ncbi:MAG: NUDIX domain-containing protein [Chloroflexi bacterium]|nr:NUDIX domain-containing protein [Chloroflexota bacterium]
MDTVRGPIPVDPSGLPDPGRPRFCGQCATPMDEVIFSDRPRPVCPSCGWTYYAKNAIGAAATVVRDGCLLLVQRAHVPYQGDWMLPAGFVEYGEDGADTIVRELVEECRLVVKVTGTPRIYFGRDDPRNPSYLLVYPAVLGEPTATPVAGDDAMACDWFLPEDIPANIAFEGQRRAIADWKSTRVSQV